MLAPTRTNISETNQMFVHSLCGNVHGDDVSEKIIQHAPDYYRARAAEMLKLENPSW
jgi:hypothetical protein